MIVAVVNADDFGLSTGINKGIQAACEDGILRSASVMANGRAFAEAAAISKDLPSLGVGIHLTLVGEQPLAPTGDLGGLVSRGALPSSYGAFTRGFLSGRFTLKEVRRELEAQIARVRNAGIAPSHLDSHQHVHLLPGVFDLALELAEAHAIGVVRIPWDRAILSPRLASVRGIQLGALAGLAMLARRKLAHGTIRAADSLRGLACSGRLDTSALRAILSRLPPGVHEIMCHPGFETPSLHERYRWGYSWEDEMKALRSAVAKELVERRGIRLCNFTSAWKELPAKDLAKEDGAGSQRDHAQDAM